MASQALAPIAVDYPSSDGKTMADNDAQRAEPKAPDFVLVSDVLGLELRARAGRQMRLHDPATGRDLLSHREEHARAEREAAARRVADSRAAREVAARQAAEARVAELEALIRDRRG